jgi:hypothetical protein
MNNLRSLASYTIPFLCACSFVVLFAGCASSANPEGENTAQASDRECRTERSAGTKMKRSVCMSAEEWAIADARNQEKEDLQNEYFRRVRENSTQGAGPQFDTPTPSAGP